MKYFSALRVSLTVGIISVLPDLYESIPTQHQTQLEDDPDYLLKINDERAFSNGSFRNSVRRNAEGDDVEKTADEITCSSDDPGFLHMINLTPKLKFHWKLDVWNEGNSDSHKVSIKLQYQGTAWLGFGISKFGVVAGSDAIIGIPAANGDKPLKYKLTSWGPDGAKEVEADKQTLTDHTITQQGGETILKFTKLLEEDGETYLNPAGHTTYLYAIGEGNSFSKPEKDGVFHLDLSRCGAGTISIGTGTYKAAWIAHATFATLAWAILSPCAIATAWFRTLVPSSWIYIHVGANVLSFIFTVIAFIIAVVTMSVSKKSHFSLTHHRIGLALMIIITFQVVNGFLRPAVERTSDPTSTEKNSKNKSFLKTTPRQMWQLTHSILGVIMVGVVFYQLGNGYDMFSNDFTVTSLVPYFYVYIGIMLLTFAVIKVWMLYEEYDAERNSSGVNSFAPEQKRMANEATSRGICPDSDLAPIQFSIE